MAFDFFIDIYIGTHYCIGKHRLVLLLLSTIKFQDHLHCTYIYQRNTCSYFSVFAKCVINTFNYLLQKAEQYFSSTRLGNIILVVYVQSLKMLLYCLTFKESAEIFCVQLISISQEISLQYCMFIHDLLENVPNAVPGRRHADKFIDHQSISPNIHYVEF